jgi:hypothetical protein
MEWGRHGKCESDTVALCKSNGEDTFWTLSGTVCYVWIGLYAVTGKTNELVRWVTSAGIPMWMLLRQSLDSVSRLHCVLMGTGVWFSLEGGYCQRSSNSRIPGASSWSRKNRVRFPNCEFQTWQYEISPPPTLISNQKTSLHRFLWANVLSSWRWSRRRPATLP